MDNIPDVLLAWRRRRLGRLDRLNSATLMDRLRVDKGESGSTSPRNRKITFARLATCILNVERARKRSSRAREEELLQAAETGDTQKLVNLLQNGRDLNIECSDQLGRTPLLLAVVNEHKEAVRMLLDYVDKRRVYQALLSAINLGNEEIAEIIIEHNKYDEISRDLRQHGRTFFSLHKLHDDNQFSDEITPLILAAQQNRFEVVMALLLKGESIEKPHKCHCACADCTACALRDELKFARWRLNAYKALASEAYISLSSDDPILISFELRKTLQQVAKEEKYYTAEYSSLGAKLSEYVVRLLDKVHGNDELNSILNAVDGNDDPDDATFKRLQLAIKYKEKKFVAHPSCQKKMTSLWYKDLHILLKNRSKHYQMPLIGLIVILYPVLAVCYMAAPNTKLGHLLRTPCIKFVAQSASYLFFLGLILVHGQLEQNELCVRRMGDLATFERHMTDLMPSGQNATQYLRQISHMCIRANRPTPLELGIIVWIMGSLWHAIKQIYTIGAQTHFVNIYNAMDFFMLKFYIASLVLRRITDFQIHTSLDFYKDIHSWERLLAQESEARYRMYWLDADRFYWDAWDPVHVCECLFAVGHILNFARLFHLLAISEHLGPMLISLERMIKDVMKFMVTFVPISLAFIVGMYNMYWYYNPLVRRDVEVEDHKIKTNAEEGFGNLELTFRTIFWSVFGLKDARVVELGAYQSRFTESVGYIVFGVYNWGAVIVLLNMLIAMMTRSFDKIATDQDIEWKFVRSKLYMEYIRRGNTLAIPFNLIPTPKMGARALGTVMALFRQQCRKGNVYDEEEGGHNYFSMNGSSSKYLMGKHYIGQCQSTQNIAEKPEEIATSETSLNFDAIPKRSRPINQMSADSESQADCNSNDYKAVMKRVVRRYIFEHLLASVVPNEGSVELENLKQQTFNIQTDIHSLQPQIDEQGQNLQSQLRLLSKNVTMIREQMSTLMEVCHDLQMKHKSKTEQETPQSQPSAEEEVTTDKPEDKYSEDAPKEPPVETVERVLSPVACKPRTVKKSFLPAVNRIIAARQSILELGNAGENSKEEANQVARTPPQTSQENALNDDRPQLSEELTFTF